MFGIYQYKDGNRTQGVLKYKAETMAAAKSATHNLELDADITHSKDTFEIEELSFDPDVPTVEEKHLVTSVPEDYYDKLLDVKKEISANQEKLAVSYKKGAGLIIEQIKFALLEGFGNFNFKKPIRVPGSMIQYITGLTYEFGNYYATMSFGGTDFNLTDNRTLDGIVCDVENAHLDDYGCAFYLRLLDELFRTE